MPGNGASSPATRARPTQRLEASATSSTATTIAVLTSKSLPVVGRRKVGRDAGLAPALVDAGDHQDDDGGHGGTGENAPPPPVPSARPRRAGPRWTAAAGRRTRRSSRRGAGRRWRPRAGPASPTEGCPVYGNVTSVASITAPNAPVAVCPGRRTTTHPAPAATTRRQTPRQQRLPVPGVGHPVDQRPVEGVRDRLPADSLLSSLTKCASRPRQPIVSTEVALRRSARRES